MVGGVGWRAVDAEGEDGFGSGCFALRSRHLVTVHTR